MANCNARRFFFVVQLCLIDNSSKTCNISSQPNIRNEALYFAWTMIKRATIEGERVT